MDHVCRHCFGRVLTRQSEDGGMESRCADCGAAVAGDYKALCCCNLRLRNGQDAQLRCIPNPSPTPEVPEQVLVRHVEGATPPARHGRATEQA